MFARMISLHQYLLHGPLRSHRIVSFALPASWDCHKLRGIADMAAITLLR
jgi:hypothetical protein